MTRAVHRLRAVVLADAEAGPITPRNVDSRYRVGKVLVDNVKGKGSVPRCQEISYFGFVAFMTPDEFLKVASQQSDHAERTIGMEALLEEPGIANPFLTINTDNMEYPWGKLKVVGHEGRARMLMIKRVNGNAPFPVQVTVPGWRAGRGHYSKEFFRELKRNLITEDGKHTGVRITRIFCNGAEIDD